MDSSASPPLSAQLFAQPPIRMMTWSGLRVERHVQFPGATPEFASDVHLLIIYVGTKSPFERSIDGHIEHGLLSYGCISVCPRNILHWLRWHAMAEFLMLAFPNDLLIHQIQSLFDTEYIELIPVLTYDDPLITCLGQALLSVPAYSDQHDQLYVETLTTILAMHLVCQYTSLPQTPNAWHAGLPRRTLQVVLAHITEYLDHNLSVNELAAMTDLSPSHFSHAFKKSTGCSPYQYIMQQRVEAAKQLLQQNKLSIAEIALTCGFSHQSHLNRYFKRLTGMTPYAFRKSQS